MLKLTFAILLLTLAASNTFADQITCTQENGPKLILTYENPYHRDGLYTARSTYDSHSWDHETVEISTMVSETTVRVSGSVWGTIYFLEGSASGANIDLRVNNNIQLVPFTSCYHGEKIDGPKSVYDYE